MTPWLASFSDWALALLPRLFLYPGLLFAAPAVAVLRYVYGGKGAVEGRALAAAVARNSTAAALAWAAVALMPLPGAAPLPVAVDRLVLAALLALSLALEGRDADGSHIGASLAALLAVMAPLAGAKALTNLDSLSGGEGWAALAAVLACLCVLMWTGPRTLAADLRWIGWLLLAASPFLTRLPVPFGAGGEQYAPMVAFGIAISAGVMASALGKERLKGEGALLICWGLAALPLAWALL